MRRRCPASRRCARATSAARRSRIWSASAEREIVLAALEANEHHIANTARELGLERVHLYKKMRALGIDHRADEAGASDEDSDEAVDN